MKSDICFVTDKKLNILSLLVERVFNIYKQNIFKIIISLSKDLYYSNDF